MLKEDGDLILLETLITGDISGAIERQEKRGKIALKNSFNLPIKYNGDLKEQREYSNSLKSMGIKILEESDDLFMKVELPEGWKIKPTDHSMWSNLIDDKGRERASIFYKAAFYDREAFISFNRRFNISYEIADYDKKLFEHQPEYIQDGFEEVFDPVENNWGFTYKAVKKPTYKKNPNYIKLTGYEKYSQPFHYEVHDNDGTILFKSNIVKTDFDYSKDRHWEFYNHRDKIVEKAKNQCKEWLNNNYPGWESSLAHWD